MDNNRSDYTEYIYVTTGVIRRKRTGLLLRDTENLFITDNNIPIPKSIIGDFSDQIQSDLSISLENPYYFTKTSPQPTNEHITQQQGYFSSVENFSISPTDTLEPIIFLHDKVKLTEDNRPIPKNKDILADEVIVKPPEIAITSERHIDQKSQILEPKSDLDQRKKLSEAKVGIITEAPIEKRENKIIEFNKDNILYEQLKQNPHRKAEEQRQSRELEELARQEQQRKKLDQERRDRETERQKQKQLQKFKEYQEQQVKKVLLQLENKKKLEKQRLDREALEKLKAKSLLDKLKEGILSLELANKHAVKKLLPGGRTFLKKHPLVQKAKKELKLQNAALEKGVIPRLEKLEELINGITRTAKVITEETQRLSQVETEKEKNKFKYKIKEPPKIEKTFSKR